MPVSPADFEFYSRMTGQPIPNTPAGRMAIAPQVYAMRRSPLSKVGDFISGAGKAAALAGGAFAGAALLSQITGKRGDSSSQEDLAPQEDSKEKEATDLIKNLHAQGAREREATASARALQASDAKAYRGMVKDSGDRIISELTAQGQPTAPAAAEIPTGSQGFRTGAITSTGENPDVFDDPNVLLDITPAEKAKAEAFLANRISNQSAVPQADMNIANESTAAQQASVGSPTDPTPVVRQQPSSGVVTTDLSNVAKLDLKEIGAQAAVQRAMNAERDQIQYKSNKPISKEHKGGSIRDPHAGIHQEPYVGMADAPDEAPRGGLSADRGLMSKMAERGNLLQPQTTQPSPSTQMTSNRQLMSEMLERGNVLPDAIEQMSSGDRSFVPTSETVGPFVSNRGREIGALLQKAQAPAAETKVDAKRMQAEERARKTVGLGHPAYETVVQNFMSSM